MIDKPIVIVCTGRGGWHADNVVELAVLAPVKPRDDLALAAGLAGIDPPEPTPAALRGYGVQGGTLTRWEPGRAPYVRRRAEAQIVDTDAGAVLVLPVCPRCWHRPGAQVSKSARRRREERPTGDRIPVRKVEAVAAMFAPVEGRIEVNVALLRR